MKLAGVWGSPTIDGEREIVVGGRKFHIPASAVVKIVRGTRGVEVAHCKVGRRVVVLSALGQLLETDQDARYRATPAPWATVAR